MPDEYASRSATSSLLAGSSDGTTMAACTVLLVPLPPVVVVSPITDVMRANSSSPSNGCAEK